MEPTLKGAMALARSAIGPLSPHLPAYVTSLIDQRYAVVCMRAKAWHATAFDAWLSSQGVDLADVQDAHVDEFIRRAYRPRSDCQAPHVATSHLPFASCWVTSVGKAYALLLLSSPSLPMCW